MIEVNYGIKQNAFMYKIFRVKCEISPYNTIEYGTQLSILHFEGILL